eukprot:scaffold12382_cov118-Isochrysis_galbana.AAC.4
MRQLFLTRAASVDEPPEHQCNAGVITRLGPEKKAERMLEADALCLDVVALARRFRHHHEVGDSHPRSLRGSGEQGVQVGVAPAKGHLKIEHTQRHVRIKERRASTIRFCKC